jgi:nardilysin
METINLIMDQISIKALYHGNVSLRDANDAKDVILSLARTMNGMPSNKRPLQMVTITPFGDENRLFFPTVDPKDPNTAVEIYFQCGTDNITDRVVVDVLMQMMAEPLYDTLRTKDQFGYSVSCAPRWSFGVIGMSFRVTTTCKSATEVCHRIDSFLLSFREDILKMSREEFVEHVIGLAKSKMEKCDSLEEETGEFWYEIIESRYDFEVHRNEAERLRAIQKQDVLDGFDKWLNPKVASRRKIEVCAIGISEGNASQGRPSVEDENVNDYIDDKVSEFHQKTSGKTYYENNYV